VIIIEPTEEYYWDGTATFFIAATPPWTIEQHKETS
jgi:hypothetical protein